MPPGSSPIYMFPSGPIVSPLGMNMSFHTSSTFPSVSNTCTRCASRSATITLSSLSTAMLCGRRNWPGSIPGSPQDLMCWPSGEYLWTLKLPYPSVINISPFFLDTAACVGRLNGSPFHISDA